MRRRKSKQPAYMTRGSEKTRLRKTAERQAVTRGSKALGNKMTQAGAVLASDYRGYGYTTYRTVQAKRNPQGKVVMREHTQRTYQRYTTEGGRNFRSTSDMRSRTSMGKKLIIGGRVVPVMGYGFVAHDVLRGEHQPLREGEGWAPMAGAYAVSDAYTHYQGGGSTIGLLTGGTQTPRSLVEMFF